MGERVYRLAGRKPQPPEGAAAVRVPDPEYPERLRVLAYRDRERLWIFRHQDREFYAVDLAEIIYGAEFSGVFELLRKEANRQGLLPEDVLRGLLPTASP